MYEEKGKAQKPTLKKFLPELKANSEPKYFVFNL
jgi:hypothetical protein